MRTHLFTLIRIIIQTHTLTVPHRRRSWARAQRTGFRRGSGRATRAYCECSARVSPNRSACRRAPRRPPAGTWPRWWTRAAPSPPSPRCPRRRRSRPPRRARRRRLETLERASGWLQSSHTRCLRLRRLRLAHNELYYFGVWEKRSEARKIPRSRVLLTVLVVSAVHSDPIFRSDSRPPPVAIVAMRATGRATATMKAAFYKTLCTHHCAAPTGSRAPAPHSPLSPPSRPPAICPSPPSRLPVICGRFWATGVARESSSCRSAPSAPEPRRGASRKDTLRRAASPDCWSCCQPRVASTSRGSNLARAQRSLNSCAFEGSHLEVHLNWCL